MSLDRLHAAAFVVACCKVASGMLYILQARCVSQPFRNISLSGISSLHVAHPTLHESSMPCNANAMHKDEEMLPGILHPLFGQPASRDLSSSLSK